MTHTNVAHNFNETTSIINNCSGNTPYPYHTYGIVDTGATQKYIKFNTACTIKVKVEMRLQFLPPYDTTIQATYRNELQLISLLATRAKTAHIFLYLQPGALISIGHLFDDGLMASFMAIHLKAEKQVKLVLEGSHNGISGMWHVNLYYNTHTVPTPPGPSDYDLLVDRNNP